MTVSPATTPGQILTSAYLNNNINSGLTYITSGALSSTATNFEGCFTSAYSNYRIVINSIALSGNGDINCRFLVGSTPNTSSSYKYAYQGYTSIGTTTNVSSDGTDNFYSGIGITGVADSVASLSMDVLSPQLAVRTAAHITAQSFSGGYVIRNGIGIFGAGTQFDGIRFYTGTAVTMSGTVSIYGYRKP